MTLLELLHYRQLNIPLTNVELDILANDGYVLTPDELSRLAEFRYTHWYDKWEYLGDHPSITNLSVLLLSPESEENIDRITSMFGHLYTDIPTIEMIPPVVLTYEKVSRYIRNSIINNRTSPIEAVDIIFCIMKDMSILEEMYHRDPLGVIPMLRELYSEEICNDIVVRIKEDIALYFSDKDTY